MSSSLPCVVSNVGEHSGVIIHGKNGYLVNDQTPQAYIKYLIPLLQDKHHYKKVSKSAFESSRQFDLKEVSKHWDEILC
jgi:glycosyltransferase involved in cell wall biosynthesis